MRKRLPDATPPRHRMPRWVPRSPMRRGRPACCRWAFSAPRCRRRFQMVCSAFSLQSQEKSCHCSPA